jgi:hypothetical protein
MPADAPEDFQNGIDDYDSPIEDCRGQILIALPIEMT